MATIGDTFTGTNGTDLADHTASGSNGGFTWVDINLDFGAGGGLNIQSNQLRSTGSGDSTALRAHSDLGSPDQTVSITVKSWNEDGGNISVGLLARKTSATTMVCYMLTLVFDNGSDALKLERWIDSGSTSLIKQESVSWNAGDVLKFVVEGTSLKGYQNTTERISATNSNITTGNYAGLHRNSDTSSRTMELDDFAASSTTGGGEETGAPMEVIQSAQETGTSTSSSIAFNFTNTPTTDNLLILIITSRTNAVFTLPSGFTANVAFTGNSDRVTIASKIQTTGNSFTVSRSPTGGDWRVVGLEVPAATFDVGDTSSTGGATSLALGPTATTGSANAIVVTGISFDGNVSNQALTNSYTKLFDDNARCGAAYKILSATGTQSTTWSWTTSRQAGAALAVYGASAAAAAAAVTGANQTII
jgi:hypothetical protein